NGPTPSTFSTLPACERCWIWEPEGSISFSGAAFPFSWHPPLGTSILLDKEAEDGPPVDLAHGRLRQFVHEKDGFGNLVRGQSAPQVGPQSLAGQAGTLPRNDGGRHRLPPFGIRRTHHDHLFHFGVFGDEDRKSTRLNSSHVKISYAVFCLK